MKKLTLFTMLFCANLLNAQLIKDFKVSEVLASDNFEDHPAWINFDQATIKGKLGLNNALGGTQTYQWSDQWGGAAINSGADASGGNQTLQVHWGGYVVLNGFQIDPVSTYQMEMIMHQPGGVDGNSNNYYGCVHLFIFQSSQIWQTQGVRVRITNGGTGNVPNDLGIDTWEGEGGVESNSSLFNFNQNKDEYYISGTNPLDYWIKLKIIFTGEGTTQSPFLLDCYLNDKYVGSKSINDLYWLGDLMIGLGNTGTTSDVTKFDDFKLSKMTKATALSNTKSDLKCYFNNSEISINISNNTSASKIEMYNTVGENVYTCVSKDSKVVIPSNIQNGMYVARITSLNGTNSNLKFIIR